METENYYGDIVRKLFFAGALVMLLTYPYFSLSLPQSPAVMVIGIVLLCVLAGLTKPERHWTIATDIIASLFFLIYFENHAIEYAKTNLTSLFFTDQILTVIFIIALYFAAKTFGNTVEIKIEKLIPRFIPKNKEVTVIKITDQTPKV